ncbi:MAG: hypothetical protein KAW47_10365 [Thermoplasmatales archaeon]|nr:hypothetical protein [Thermoplasmatales archaeon]
MTIRVRKPNIFDKILSCMGKKRGLIIPDNVYEEFGPYAYAQAKRESLWKALLRPTNASLPDGVIEWNEMMTTIKMDYYRREVLFCHDLFSFIETEFSGAVFGDNLTGSSRTEIYFVFKNAFYLLEAKGEVETDGTKHPGWKGTFQDVREAIHNLSFDN